MVKAPKMAQKPPMTLPMPDIGVLVPKQEMFVIKSGLNLMKLLDA